MCRHDLKETGERNDAKEVLANLPRVVVGKSAHEQGAFGAYLDPVDGMNEMVQSHPFRKRSTRQGCVLIAEVSEGDANSGILRRFIGRGGSGSRYVLDLMEAPFGERSALEPAVQPWPKI
jgi:hypothetical protein